MVNRTHDKILPEDFVNLISDKKSGSTYIAINALLYAKRLFERQELDPFTAFRFFRTKGRNMRILSNVGILGLRFLKQNIDPIKICEKILDDILRCVSKGTSVGREVLNLYSSFLTFSNSEQLSRLFTSLSGVSVFVVTSRLASEGNILANVLNAHGISVRVVKLSDLRTFLKKVDCLVTGSDTIFEGSFLNRRGTLLLAEQVKYSSKPYFVLSMKWKVALRSKLCISTPDFECIPNSLSNGFLTELGMLSPTNVYESLRSAFAEL